MATAGSKRSRDEMEGAKEESNIMPENESGGQGQEKLEGGAGEEVQPEIELTPEQSRKEKTELERQRARSSPPLNPTRERINFRPPKSLFLSFFLSPLEFVLLSVI